MNKFLRRLCQFLLSYGVSISVVFGCVEVLTYFTGEWLRDTLGLIWPFIFYGIPLLAAAYTVYIGDKKAADKLINAAKEKVQSWGMRISDNDKTWDDGCWHLLGHALQFAHEATENAPRYQRAWTILADIYHYIGKEELGRNCLKKSYNLATRGPNHPGDFYKSVEKKMRSGYPFNRIGGLTRQSPPSWFETKYQKYWMS